MTLKSVELSRLTVFSEAELRISKQLNVIVGENGAGKTHILKLIYAVIASSWEERRRPGASSPTKTGLQTRIAGKLVGVFRPETLGRLATRRQGNTRCDVTLSFVDTTLDIRFGFATRSTSEVAIAQLPTRFVDSAPAYLPTRELLTIYPNFVSLYDTRFLEFEETWRDTCSLLGTPLQRGQKEARINELARPLEEAMGGSIQLDARSGRFYLLSTSGRMEVPLVAEGMRKLGMIARLIATGTLLDNGYLFWDEPEANLNPKLIRRVAKTIVALSRNGIQVFIATHSLFLMRELEILLATPENKKIRPKFFGLHPSHDGVIVQQGRDISSIGDIASLDEELQQSDRFFEVENQ